MNEMNEKEFLQDVLENALVELNRALQNIADLNKQIGNLEKRGSKRND